MIRPSSISSFSVFGFEIKLYGVMLFLGMVLGIFAICFITKKKYPNLDSNLLLDFFPWLIIVSVISARLYYILLNLSYYLSNKSEILAFRHGGISIHGAILGGIIFSVIYFKYVLKKPLLPYADVISFGLPLGQAVGRWGNYFNQEAFGLPCNLPWKLYVSPQFRPETLQGVEFYHPAFLYESVIDILIFLILYFIVRKIVKNHAGVVFYSYLALYSIGRFFIEGIRIDSAFNLFNVPIAQVVSVLIFVFAIIALILAYKKPEIKE